jgi:hypothetical protein
MIEHKEENFIAIDDLLDRAEEHARSILIRDQARQM